MFDLAVSLEGGLRGTGRIGPGLPAADLKNCVVVAKDGKSSVEVIWLACSCNLHKGGPVLQLQS